MKTGFSVFEYHFITASLSSI